MSYWDDDAFEAWILRVQDRGHCPGPSPEEIVQLRRLRARKSQLDSAKPPTGRKPWCDSRHCEDGWWDQLVIENGKQRPQRIPCPICADPVREKQLNDKPAPLCKPENCRHGY